MREVQKIACSNNAGFVMSFVAKTVGAGSVSTDNYPINQTCTIDLASTPFREGLEFWPEVHAILGKTQSAGEHVIFKMNGQTATYEVRGTTQNYSINLIGDQPSPLPPACFPANIPLNFLPFKNWAEDIEVKGVWTCAPQSADDVVLVCNWAKEQGYKVRATGIKHTWSPLTVVNDTPSDAKIILVDTTKNLNQMTFIPAPGNQSAQVRVATGATMEGLLTYLENQPGGKGSAPGYSFPHTPAPGHLTVGGVLAINGHGTAIRTSPNDTFNASYGSMSNQILEFTAVVTDPTSSTPDQYTLRTFKRGKGDDKAFLTHLGRAFLVEVVLQVIDNYNLRCQSYMNITWETLFQAPTPSSPAPDNSFADFLNRYGRIEIIWFPFSEKPWLHLWTVAPQKPANSRQVNSPYNYPFADNLDPVVSDFLKNTIGGFLSSWTPEFGKLMATVTDNGFAGKNFLGIDTYPPSHDIWGSSKNTLLYIKDSTLRVTANGYAIHLKKTDIQQAVHDFTFKFQEMLTRYKNNSLYPINSALEIRVTNLDDPQYVAVTPGMKAESPVISSLSQDELATHNQWDIALWVDVLTMPGTPGSNQFYREIEDWLLQRFSGNAGRVLPEWSKGWAYTDNGGPWTNQQFIENIRQSFTTNRDSNNNWKFEVETLKKYDRYNLFSNPLLDMLFTTP